jgi:hypothetical protein
MVVSRSNLTVAERRPFFRRPRHAPVPRRIRRQGGAWRQPRSPTRQRAPFNVQDVEQAARDRAAWRGGPSAGGTLGPLTKRHIDLRRYLQLIEAERGRLRRESQEERGGLSFDKPKLRLLSDGQ